MDVAQAKPETPATGDVSLQRIGGGRLLAGRQPEAAPIPVDDVHQALSR